MLKVATGAWTADNVLLRKRDEKQRMAVPTRYANSNAKIGVLEDGVNEVPEQPRLCPRCQQPMASGALRTRIESGFGDWLAVAGSNRVRWAGDGGPYRVTAYRCPSCGVVELKATERPKASGCLAEMLLLAGLMVGVGVAAGWWVAN
jgi:hypothetical protein